jgi:hypothetical protein
MGLTLKRDWVRIFSTKSRLGILSFRPPNGAFSTFTNPLRRRTLRLLRTAVEEQAQSWTHTKSLT